MPRPRRPARVCRRVPATGRSEPDRDHPARPRPRATRCRRSSWSRAIRRWRRCRPRRRARRCVHCCRRRAVRVGHVGARSAGRRPLHATGGARRPGRDAFAALPRAYVMCLQDRAVRPSLQRRFARDRRRRPGDRDRHRPLPLGVAAGRARCGAQPDRGLSSPASAATSRAISRPTTSASAVG